MGKVASKCKNKGKRHKNRRKSGFGLGITKPAIKRLARRGGVKRISSNIYLYTNHVLKAFLSEVLSNAIAITENRKRKTVSVMDIVYALRHQGRTIYGF